MRLLYLDWPHLPLRLELAQRGQSDGGGHASGATAAGAQAAAPSELIVLGGHPWEPGTVLDCSAAAARLGVSRGQALGSAHNLVPEAVFLEPHEDAYHSAFEAALRALSEFTPALEGETEPRHSAFGQAFLGIEGLTRLWGAEPVLVQRVTRAVAALLPGVPRVGIGNTRFGAQVAAVVGERDAGRRTIPIGGMDAEAAWLAPLSINLLPADQETRDRFRLFGLTSIGQFAALDRSAVLARFGTPGGELLDLARGMDGRPLKPRRPVERLRAEAELEPPVEELEPLRFVLHNLSGALCEQLSARGAGAGSAVLTLTLERAEPMRYEQALPEPVAASDLIERLLLARLEADPPRHPVERLSLQLDGTAPAAGQQLGLFTPQLARAARLDWQLASLRIRFGDDRVLQAELGDPEAGLAEERFSWRAAGPLAGPVTGALA